MKMKIEPRENEIEKRLVKKQSNLTILKVREMDSKKDFHFEKN